MKLLKINNLININPLFGVTSGVCDYKTLDINQFIPNSQVYPDYDNFCLVATTEVSYIQHSDIEELTEEQYKLLSAEVENKNEELRQPSPEEANAQRISELETAILQGQGVI